MIIFIRDEDDIDLRGLEDKCRPKFECKTLLLHKHLDDTNLFFNFDRIERSFVGSLDYSDFFRADIVFFLRTNIELRPFFLSNDNNDDTKKFIQEQWFYSLLSFFMRMEDDFGKSKWINLPSSLFNQFNKTYYLQIAYRYGFKVPHFIITDQLDKRAEEILETKDWVNKSISTNQFIGNRRFTTTRFNKQTLYKKESHLGIPILFQEYIKPEFEIRLFFMLETTYSIAIKRKKGSLEDDIRVIDASNLEVEEVSTPDYINKSVVSYCKENYFNYCCFDFLYSSDAYYLIDINPFGSWKYYEENFNIPITDKFVNAIEKYINTLKLHT